MPALRALFVAAAVALATPALAQSACSGIANPRARLDCYDRAPTAPAPRSAYAPPAAPQATRAAAAGGFTCGAKRYCREMTNCAEARYHLRQCGLGRLDADHDGVPCESLCR